jgi:protein-S-isoprenylcysteine O-methyltransferase Ste14
VHGVEYVFAVGWTAFWIYWLVAARSARRGHIAWSAQLGIRAVLLVAVVAMVHLGVFRGGAGGTGLWSTVLGLCLFVLGLGLAIWARVHIGRSWGLPMSQQDAPELVTSGPYRWIRHPIYSGILVAGVGTAAALGWRWLVAVGLAGVYFVYSAIIEERYLTAELPDVYPSYKQGTKMLVPFVF